MTGISNSYVYWYIYSRENRVLGLNIVQQYTDSQENLRHKYELTNTEFNTRSKGDKRKEGEGFYSVLSIRR